MLLELETWLLSTTWHFIILGSIEFFRVGPLFVWKWVLITYGPLISIGARLWSCAASLLHKPSFMEFVRYPREVVRSIYWTMPPEIFVKGM